MIISSGKKEQVFLCVFLPAVKPIVELVKQPPPYFLLAVVGLHNYP